MGLSVKRQRFVDFYDGNGVEACRRAGFKGNEKVLATEASRLLKIAEIRIAIDARLKKEAKATIKSRVERQAFWSKVMSTPSVDMAQRLKASELLGRSEADFTEKVEVRGELTLLELVNESREKTEDKKS